MADELAACPFCGGKAVLTNVRHSGHQFKVGCYNEFCWRPGTDYYGSAEAATTAWNTRARLSRPSDEMVRNASDAWRAYCSGPTRVLTAEQRNDAWRAALTAAFAAHPSPQGGAEPDELKPHYHVPSTMHMGDCAICGNIAGSPIHTTHPIGETAPAVSEAEVTDAMINAALNEYLPACYPTCQDAMRAALEAAQRARK